MTADYYRENREKIREYQRKYYQRHRERCAKCSSEWKKENREYYLQYQREYYIKNKERIRKRKALKYQQSKEQ